MEKAAFVDHYAVLGCVPGMPLSSLEAAYHRNLREVHAGELDLPQHKLLQAMHEAWAVLRYTSSRQDYDKQWLMEKGCPAAKPSEVRSLGPMGAALTARRFWKEGSREAAHDLLEQALDCWPRSHDLLGVRAEFQSHGISDPLEGREKVVAAAPGNSLPCILHSSTTRRDSKSALTSRPSTPLPGEMCQTRPGTPASSCGASPLPSVSASPAVSPRSPRPPSAARRRPSTASRGAGMRRPSRLPVPVLTCDNLR
ncbi:cbpA [Symbiodinium natans]|uniref:CbpA protein n=1 Tax=Symbiodinium natans TaxID=878477 RepID=A0A812NA32_9DINO|nr:cbpA [Symbiodinium natans]